MAKITSEILSSMTKTELVRLATTRGGLTASKAKKLQKDKLIKALRHLTEENEMAKKIETDATDTDFDFNPAAASAPTEVANDEAEEASEGEVPAEGPKMARARVRLNDHISVAFRAVNKTRDEKLGRFNAFKGAKGDAQDTINWFADRTKKYCAMAFTLTGKANADTIHVVGVSKEATDSMCDLLLAYLPAGVDQPHLEVHHVAAELEAQSA